MSLLIFIFLFETYFTSKIIKFKGFGFFNYIIANFKDFDFEEAEFIIEIEI